ncbi:unnamed protein product [Rotaria sp. Silwood1]|nr:unnamed protein product [Rotaria sp. Silwood1]
MSSYVELLNKAAQQVNIVVGIVFLVLGVIGNCLNIVMFSSLLNIKLFPSSPSRLYLLTTAIADFIFVAYLLTTRIMISGFFIPLTNTINFICKSRFFIGQVCIYISLFCTCFATIDQYLLSSRSVKVRQLSQLSFARIIVLILIIVSCLINMPELFIYNVYSRGNGTSTICTVYSSSWTFYFTYIQSLVILCLLPLSIFIIFNILTKNNLRSVRQVHQSIADQMTRMVLLRAMTMALSLLVATVQIIYQAVTLNIQKDTLRIAQDNMLNTVANLLTYVNYICGFYIYLYSSKSLRRNFKDILLNHEQIHPMDITTRFTRDRQVHITNYNRIKPVTNNSN